MSLREHVMEAVAAVEVMVPAGELLALLDERDALKDRVSMLEFRLGFGVSGPPKVETIEHPNGSIEGGWDIQDGDEMVTVNVEPPAGDCSCKETAPPVFPMHPKVAALAQDIERAVCGSRQPPGQVVESPPPVLVDKPFVSDKGAGKPSQTVVPWSSKLTPNQTALIIRMLGEGASGVTAAANARCLTQHVGGVMAHYRHQIEALQEMNTGEREKYIESLYRQMLARWQAAGKDPAYQPELPLPNKTLSEAAKPDKPGKGRASA